MQYVSSSGLNSLHDGLVIHFDKKWIEKMIDDAANPHIADNEFRNKYQVEDSRDWKLAEFRKKAIGKGANKYRETLTKCLYRPFDERWIVLNDDFVGYARWETTSHFLSPTSLGLATARQSLTTISCLASNIPFGQHKIVDPYNRSYVFPLYLYTTPAETAGTLFAQSEMTRRPNLAPAFIQALEEKLKLKFDPSPSLPKSANRTSVAENTSMADLGRVSEGRVGFFTPEDIFHYVYAVFHCPAYRSRYAEFLKIDFPRLPITSDKKLFAKLAAKGKELVELHLLKSAKVEDFVTTYPVAGSNKVEKVVFARQTSEVSKTSKVSGRVWINAEQYFGKVPAEVWGFKVGGYQVCEKWLKDRKGRVLSREDIDHYQRVVVALKETIRLMKEIDKAIVKWPIE